MGKDQRSEVRSKRLEGRDEDKMTAETTEQNVGYRHKEQRLEVRG